MKSLFRITQSLIIIAVLVAGVAFGSYRVGLLSPTVDSNTYRSVDLEAPKSQLMEQVNKSRVDQGMQEMSWDFGLYYSALKSAKMIYEGEREWSHDNFKQIISESYPDAKMVGENLARDFTNEEDVYESWLNSASHSAVMFKENACQYGFANYQTVYVLHVGCRRESAQKQSSTIISGLASYYSVDGCLGCSPTLTMANGERLDDAKLTVAYNRAPLNSYVEIKNVKNGKVVKSRVTDTGGFERHGKIIDLNVATKDAIECGGTCQVEIKHL